MTDVSLLGVASYLPERIVHNDFFAPGASARRGMFTAPRERRHVRPDESAAEMIERAAQRLVTQLDLNPLKDIDVLFTNVAVPDEAFTGCGAEVAHRIGCRPRYVLDLHNSGCVSFIYMLQLARLMMLAGGVRTALLCNVQNAGGRVFADPQIRLTSHAPVPGDGAGVGFVAASEVSPVLSLVQACHGEFAADMQARAADGRRYWQPGSSPLDLCFDERRVAAIIERGNRIVPEMVSAACGEAGVNVRDIDLLVTNQPNPIFLRNWREALELCPEVHHDTFDRYGNLFGAALPINLGDALAWGKLRPGGLLALGGFSHAGDYAAAAVLRWQKSPAGGGR
jgi:3-oxoacyl-[acyl-carrier-protein] synthase III